MEKRFILKAIAPISHGVHEGSYWIHPSGKGSFGNSPAIKERVEAAVESRQFPIIIDLEEVTGMDSTFMGMLAGLAIKLQQQGQKLQLTGVSESNKASLVELGLDHMMEINPQNESWCGKEDEIRRSLQSVLWEKEASLGEHVLTCHRNLYELNDANKDKFGSVMEVLKKQV